MSRVSVWMDEQKIEIEQGSTILDAARAAGIYIPVLCSHPDLSPAAGLEPVDVVHQGGLRVENTENARSHPGCRLCLVEVEGEHELVRACATPVKDGMRVVTTSERVVGQRRENLIPILAAHRHACLVCARKDGCSLSRCPSNVPEIERCCALFGNCELQKVAEYIGISPRTPRWIPSEELPVTEEALFVFDYNLCIGCTRCVRACNDLIGAGVLGFVYDSQGCIRVGSIRENLTESGCRYCGACVQVCPTGALMDRDVPARDKGEWRVPCMESCPADVKVPEYLRLAAAGRFREACKVIMEKAPFPGILGRVCTRPCEDNCRRGLVDEPIAIRAVKRYAAEYCCAVPGPVSPESGKRAAVVGAGPAGLTAAYYLRLAGHRVSVIERFPEPGGMLRYGIPAFRLPKEIVEGETALILKTGIEFRPGVVFGQDATFSSLREEGFDAFFLATGAWLPLYPGFEGAGLCNVMTGIEFLRQSAVGPRTLLEGETLVIGGGDTSVDAALTALRCGSSTVTVVCPEPLDQMPAGSRGIGALSAEGVAIRAGYGVRRIMEKDGRAAGVEIAHCVSFEHGRGDASPVLAGPVETLRGRNVIIAAGQVPDTSYAGEDPGIRVSEGFIAVEAAGLETGAPGVFAGGDAARRGGSVVSAVAAGRRAAVAIDLFLGGRGKLGENDFGGSSFTWPGKLLPGRAREPEKEIDSVRRRSCFDEVFPGYNEIQARAEAGRCLQCDLRLKLRPNPLPPERILPFTVEDVLRVPEGPGVFRLYNAEHDVVEIKGAADLKENLSALLDQGCEALWFDYEECVMFSTRESELMRDHLRRYGSMPGLDDLDDLF